MEKLQSDCPCRECFFCVMKESNPSKRRSSIRKFFRDLPNQDSDGQVLPISGIWNTAMSNPNDPEFLNLGLFDCMASLIWKGLKNRRWLSQDQNIYIPYYAAHIIGSYTMNLEEFAQIAVQAGVIPPLVELLRGRLTWVEQRVAVRALGHLATYPSSFPAVAEHGEILDIAIQLASSSLEIVYSHFYKSVERRPGYHCDLLTRGMGGVEMENRKAEEWASQLQCWSLQLINCFAFKSEYLSDICNPGFLTELPGMWGGLVNESSPAGVGLLRTICQHRIGRGPVADCGAVVEALCNISRSSDDWQCMAVDCLLWLVQDPNTCHKVIDKAAETLIDLSDITSLGDHKRLGETIISTLQSLPLPPNTSPSSRTQQLLDELALSLDKSKLEKSLPKEDLRIKQAASLVIKLEGNSLFSSGNISGAARKYSEALEISPSKSKRERVVLYSNRAQCYLLLQQPYLAISDSTKALSMHAPINRHAKSLWRRAQAYDMIGLAKESLLDAILFINACTGSAVDQELRNGGSSRVPDYAEKLVKKQMGKAWLFREAAMKHGGVSGDRFLGLGLGLGFGQDGEDSEWETASESDDDDDDDDGNDEGIGETDAYTSKRKGTNHGFNSLIED